MTNEELNLKVYRLLKRCLHKWERDTEIEETIYQCPKCDNRCLNIITQLDFTSSWEGFGLLWEWWQKQNDFGEFITSHNAHSKGSNFECLNVRFISPYALAEATVEFFKE